MDRRYVVPVVIGVLVLLLLGLFAGALDPVLTTGGFQPDGEWDPSGEATPDDEYPYTTATVLDGETNETLGAVRVAVAETYRQKYTGLSKTESLPEDAGMLFPYDSEGSHTYVMRGMEFGIDIVYVGSNGTITQIHHAPAPPDGEDGESYRYPGTGQYVLEVNYEWTTRHGVSEGDTVRTDDW